MEHYVAVVLSTDKPISIWWICLYLRLVYPHNHVVTWNEIEPYIYILAELMYILTRSPFSTPSKPLSISANKLRDGISNYWHMAKWTLSEVDMTRMGVAKQKVDEMDL